ncbi:hypothetical protein IMG5_076410 [Ichthyophthirius multifiliis]|uniref:Uncharacterized protein n=1 Tax=Ichthyophthirius multifiliis TaxID=5932 RepID=G0QQB0_ICHMU|nr:hypothetical protein IMG5_076410 [Ichthyophthirius multifiliis]EGR32612.1 hypothetical protein IMG5_076410 [Ichthyophthirius multifiliis]|eukprot:XP_004036598.1 hypothetical protein IMG5_076410 [Ichthyophthirius multifiliis]
MYLTKVTEIKKNEENSDKENNTQKSFTMNFLQQQQVKIIKKPPKKLEALKHDNIIPPKPPQKDYIKELRSQREEQGRKIKLEAWEKYVYDPKLSENEKISHILQSANRLEHKAELQKDIEAQNNLYIDSIKAKLAILNNIC